MKTKTEKINKAREIYIEVKSGVYDAEKIESVFNLIYPDFPQAEFKIKSIRKFYLKNRNASLLH